MHNLLASEITFDGAGDSELWFGIGQRRLKFSNYEFYFLTGLKFKELTYIPWYNDKVVEGGVHQKYWPSLKVDVITLENRLCEIGLRFDHWKDALKMALVLFMKRFLFDAN